MNLRWFLDPESGLPHIYGHGVTEEEVRHVLRHPGERTRSDRNSWVVLGQTQAGRYLRVVYVPDKVGDGVFVVTAFELKGKPLRAYKRRRKHR